MKDKDGKGGKVVKTTGSLDAKNRYCPLSNSSSCIQEAFRSCAACLSAKLEQETAPNLEASTLHWC